MRHPRAVYVESPFPLTVAETHCKDFRSGPRFKPLPVRRASDASSEEVVEDEAECHEENAHGSNRPDEYVETRTVYEQEVPPIKNDPTEPSSDDMREIRILTYEIQEEDPLQHIVQDWYPETPHE